MLLENMFCSGFAGLSLIDLATASRVDPVLCLQIGKSWPSVLHAAQAGFQLEGSTVSFDASEAEAAGLSPVDSPMVSDLIGQLNERVSRGMVVIGAGGWNDISGSSPAYYDGTVFSGSIANSSLEITVHYYWWGMTIALNKDAVKLISDMLNAGAAAAGVAAALQALGIVSIGAAALTSLISCIMWLGSSMHTLMEKCNGVDICRTWNGLAWMQPG